MKIIVEAENWECGDGCCSDYWINICLQNKEGKVISRAENLRSFGYLEDYVEEIKAYALEYFDLKEEEIDEWNI